MLSFASAIRATLACAVLIVLAGCGNSCFVAFSNNGNGGVIIKTSNPPPSCSLTQANGIMSVVATSALPCETCSPTGRLQHVFVTLRGIQLRPDRAEEASSADWLEIAPELAGAPRELDLAVHAAPQVLVQSAAVPAGTYREVRLQFLSDAAQGANARANNLCGNGRSNCVVMSNGNDESLQQPELLLPLEYAGNSLLLWPGSRTELRISLTAAAAGPYASNNHQGVFRTMLRGQATALRHPPEE